jgi:hypothetical protein
MKALNLENIRHFFTASVSAGLLIVFGIVLFIPDSAKAATRSDVKRIIVEEALNAHVSPALALAVAKVESDFREDAVSNKGARGVMQIMPTTAKGEFGVRPARLWNPRANVRLGIAYLKQLHKQYGNRWDLALSHYNGGTLEGRGAFARAHGYTRKYVRDVISWRNRYKRNVTVMALIRDAKRGGVQMASAEQPYRSDYWMLDDPVIEKDWRHYLRVADKFLRGEGHTAEKYEEAGSNSRFAQETPTIAPWVEMDRPSDRWRRRLENRRKSFRRKLHAYETDSGYARWSAWAESS